MEAGAEREDEGLMDTLLDRPGNLKFGGVICARWAGVAEFGGKNRSRLGHFTIVFKVQTGFSFESKL
jgi:hypothetical protein